MLKRQERNELENLSCMEQEIYLELVPRLVILEI